ncbi:hypothetical protein K438DRAFT_1761760 [Mycena galopus ATCC 62051]|nr:hypothetical protein K438DRAFT_1761760 [Mycena galopus ATCC 62051]
MPEVHESEASFQLASDALIDLLNFSELLSRRSTSKSTPRKRKQVGSTKTTLLGTGCLIKLIIPAVLSVAQTILKVSFTCQCGVLLASGNLRTTSRSCDLNYTYHSLILDLGPLFLMVTYSNLQQYLIIIVVLLDPVANSHLCTPLSSSRWETTIKLTEKKMSPRNTRPQNPVVLRQTGDERPQADHPSERDSIVKGGWVQRKRCQTLPLLLPFPHSLLNLVHYVRRASSLGWSTSPASPQEMSAGLHNGFPVAFVAVALSGLRQTTPGLAAASLRSHSQGWRSQSSFSQVWRSRALFLQDSQEGPIKFNLDSFLDPGTGFDARASVRSSGSACDPVEWWLVGSQRFGRIRELAQKPHGPRAAFGHCAKFPGFHGFVFGFW